MIEREHGVTFWKKDSGNFLTHRGGLSEEDIATLQSLKVGDRLIIFVNNKRNSDSAYHLMLRRFKDKKEFTESKGLIEEGSI